MSTPAKTNPTPRAAKIVIRGRRLAVKGDNGNAVYMARRRAEIAQHRFMCALLIRWGRGFSIEDAPPDLRWRCSEQHRHKRVDTDPLAVF